LDHEKTLKFWKAKKKVKAGRLFTYSDEAIQAMLVVRLKYQLSLRELEGLFQFLAKLLGIPQIPSYTQICRRMRSIKLPENLIDRRGVTNLVFDATGLKIHGEGEWCAKRYGGKAKWMKLHIGIEQKNGKLAFTEVTEEQTHDTALLEKALKRCNRRKGKVLFDGIADSKRCYEVCKRHNKELLSPPSRKAVLRKEPEYCLRNDALRIIKGLGGDELARTNLGETNMVQSKKQGRKYNSQMEKAPR